MSSMVGPYLLDRVYQGDCLELMEKMPDKSVGLVLTSPPFKDEDIGLGFNDSDHRIKTPGAIGKYNKWLRRRLDELMRIGEVVMMFNSSTRLIDICRMSPKPMRVLMWDKVRTEGAFRYEPIFVYGSKLNGTVFNDCIRALPIRQTAALAPYQNPVKLYEQLIRYVPDARVVLDPFLGSGTTAVAAKRLGRRFLGFELSPDYVKLAERRLANVPRRLEEYL